MYNKNAQQKVYNNLQELRNLLKYLPVQGCTYNNDFHVNETNEIKFLFCTVLKK